MEIASTLLIMAGGMGKRMGELTREMPKPLLNVRGKPMIQHILDMAVSEGFKNIFISTYYKSELIEEFCGDGSKFGANITILRESKPLGTGGSFSLIPFTEGPIVVTNADIMSAVGYRRLLDYHLAHDAFATIAVREHVVQHQFGVIRHDGIKLTGFDEKPIWKTNISAGIYVLDARMRDYIAPKSYTDMPEIIERARASNKSVIIFPLHEMWSDLGSESDYLAHK